MKCYVISLKHFSSLVCSEMFVWVLVVEEKSLRAACFSIRKDQKSTEQGGRAGSSKLVRLVKFLPDL